MSTRNFMLIGASLVFLGAILAFALDADDPSLIGSGWCPSGAYSWCQG